MADILVAMRNGQYGQAEELLDAAQRLWDVPRMQKAFQYIGRLQADMKTENEVTVHTRDLHSLQIPYPKGHAIRTRKFGQVEFSPSLKANFKCPMGQTLG